MNPTHPKKTQTPIKTIGKHKFYDIRAADQMAHSRLMVAEVSEIYIRSGISEGFLKEISNILVELGMNNNKPLNELRSDIVKIGHNLEGRIGLIASREMYESLACVYFLMDDEPLEYDAEWSEKKKRVWRDAGEQDFFTVRAFQITNALNSLSTKDILNVFQAGEERIAQLPEIPNLT